MLVEISFGKNRLIRKFVSCTVGTAVADLVARDSQGRGIISYRYQGDCSGIDFCVVDGILRITNHGMPVPFS